MDKKKVGILGGGQLGRMLIEAASRLNIGVSVLDSKGSPAMQIESTQNHVVGNFTDPEKIRELAAQVQVLTIEIEHVNAQVLAELSGIGCVVHPSPETVRLIQDKYLQKQHLTRHGIPVADFVECESSVEAIRLAGQKLGYPFMLKSKTLAYDGRGNFAVQTEKDIERALQALSKTPLYAEKWAKFQCELAVMVVRRANGEVKSYPVVETVHKNNICHLVFAPAQIDGVMRRKAQEIAEEAVKTLTGAGVFGVEMFAMEDGSILLNEIAPRPHNSGHYTIEACNTSQYENHLRAILDLPLGSTELKVPAAAMINILGQSTMEETLRPCSEALLCDGATIHLYGKSECRPGRKMGHITVVGQTMSEVHSRLRPILSTMGEGDREMKVNPLVGIIMGSDSDLPVMKVGAKILRDFGVPFELTLVSAHRTPQRMADYARTAHQRGLKAIIAGAGGAAHLPGMVAAMTPLPVIGVPVKLSSLDGIDSLYSIVQMPRGVPVATVAINNSTNAALLAIRLLGSFVPEYQQKMIEYTARMEEEVMAKVSRLDKVGWDEY
ncbi:uncharacterized protein VTP21DRAFT_2447 [Calcarisporiella thermophila]|uniref:uncharacterized protein n=1 Tax=Calcarisporiella thermophila TaxID=911321 RepID=UPI0037437117